MSDKQENIEGMLKDVPELNSKLFKLQTTVIGLAFFIKTRDKLEYELNSINYTESLEILELLQERIDILNKFCQDFKIESMSWNKNENALNIISDYDNKIIKIRGDLRNLLDTVSIENSEDLENKINFILMNKLNPMLNSMVQSFLFNHNNLQRDLLSKELKKAKEIVKDIKSASRAVNGGLTEGLYIEESVKYKEISLKYEIGFYTVLGFSLLATVLSIAYYYEHKEALYGIIAIKVILIIISITLATFFIRRMSHYSKLADQANQTALELGALPLFTKEVTTEAKEEIYKKLAEKYFGKELDQTQNDKIADLIQDQAKMSIDIAKATTEMVKSLKDVKSDKDSKDSDSK